MTENNERPNVKFIPDNYQNGLNLLGFNFPARNVFEGGIVAAIALISSFAITSFVPMDFGTKIGICISVSICLGFIGIRGINDEPISEYLLNLNKQKKRRRTAYAYPSARTWVKPYLGSDNQKTEELPKEKIAKFIKKFKSKMQSKASDKTVEYQSNNYFDASTMFFKEDERAGKTKPVEYMNEKELKEHEKQEAQMKKKMEKLAKKLEREERNK